MYKGPGTSNFHRYCRITNKNEMKVRWFDGIYEDFSRLFLRTWHSFSIFFLVYTHTNALKCLVHIPFIFQAFVISFTSDFIPRLVYQYMYSNTGTMHGFIDHTLSYFNVSDFQPGTAPVSTITVCRWAPTIVVYTLFK